MKKSSNRLNDMLADGDIPAGLSRPPFRDPFEIGAISRWQPDVYPDYKQVESTLIAGNKGKRIFHHALDHHPRQSVDEKNTNTHGDDQKKKTQNVGKAQG